MLTFLSYSGKRKKLNGVKTEVDGSGSGGGVLYEQHSSVSSDGSVRLEIVNQPEVQHRARYQTEGSRGAIKDRAGTGHPVFKLTGYSAAVNVEMYIGNDAGRVAPHMFYQACKVTGKNSVPCIEKKVEGTDVIEVGLEAGLEKILICDCVGILKERFADVEARFPKQKNWKSSKKKSTKCRLVMRAAILNKAGKKEVLQVTSGVINCTQLPGTPEILRMNTTTSSVAGGGELWMIGKNFLKDTSVVFSYSVPGKKEPLWSKHCEPEKDFIHQSHLITIIPPFFNLKVEEEVEISLFVKCGDKLSDSYPFTYTPIKRAAASSTSNAAASLERRSEIAVISANNSPSADQFIKTGSSGLVTVIKTNSSTTAADKKPKSQLIDSVYSHKMKKSRLDYNGRSVTRRTRSVPRPKSIPRLILINEDTNLVEDTNHFKSQTSAPTTNFSNSLTHWKGVRKMSPIGVSDTPVSPPEPQAPPRVYDTSLTKRSYSIEEDDSQTANLFHKDATFHHEESSDTSRSDFSSSLTNDFSAVFTGPNKAGLTTTFPTAKHSVTTYTAGAATGAKNSSTGFQLSASKPEYQPPANTNTFHQSANPTAAFGSQESTASGFKAAATVFQPPPEAAAVAEVSTFQATTNASGGFSSQPGSASYLELPPANQPTNFPPQANISTFKVSANPVSYQPLTNLQTYTSTTEATTYPSLTTKVSYQASDSSAAQSYESSHSFSSFTTQQAPAATGVGGGQERDQLIQERDQLMNSWRSDTTIQQRSSKSLEDGQAGLDHQTTAGTAAPAQSTNSVSVSATDDDKATISISLPSSILKDKKHFQNVIETINNTLLKNPGDEGGQCSEEHKDQHPHQQQQQQAARVPTTTELPSTTSSSCYQQPSKAPITSVPISVLHKNRKRNYSNEAETEVYSATLESSTQEARQESKWNAEFNEAYKSVVEEEVLKDSMDWEEPGQTKSVEKFPSTSMEWSVESNEPLTTKAFFSSKPPVQLSEVESALGISSFNGTSTAEMAAPSPNSASDLPTTSLKGKADEASSAQYHYEAEPNKPQSFSFNTHGGSLTKGYVASAMAVQDQQQQQQQQYAAAKQPQYISVQLRDPPEASGQAEYVEQARKAQFELDKGSKDQFQGVSSQPTNQQQQQQY